MQRLLARFTVLLLVVWSACPHANSAEINSRLRSLMASHADSSSLPAYIIMERQPDIAGLNAMVRDMPRDERSAVVAAELHRLVEQTQAGILRDLAEMQNDGRVAEFQSLPLCNGIRLKAAPLAIAELAQRSDIRYIMDDSPREPPPLHPAPMPNIDRFGWGVERINAPEVWFTGARGYTGAGVVIAVIDGGVDYAHPDLVDHMWDGGREFPYHGYDFYDNDLDPMDMYNGHGTHCAGIAAGDGTAGIRTGVAPDASIMAVRVGHSPTSIWQGMFFALEQGADVISMSLGRFCDPTERMLWRNNFNVLLSGGLTSVAAAGNHRGLPQPRITPGDCPSPWRHPDQAGTGSQGGVITVGATNQVNTIANFSTPGPADWTDVPFYHDWPSLIIPDISAPGVDIPSLEFRTGGYFLSSGTSMATPHVAGVVALMLSKDFSLEPVEIDSILQMSALPRGTPGKDNDYGAGLLQADAAVAMVNAGFGHLRGIVRDANSNEPLQGVAISATRYFTYADSTDGSGRFSIPELCADSIWAVTVHHPPYQHIEMENVVIDSADTTSLEILLECGSLTVDQTSLEFVLPPGETAGASIQLTAEGTAPVEVEAEVRPLLPMDAFFTELLVSHVSDSTGDNIMRGIAAGPNRLYVAGSFNFLNPNRIYRFDHEGNYLGEVVQPTETPVGMRDITWDGSALYGTDGPSIVKCNPETGSGINRFPGPYNSNTALAFDRVRSVLYTTYPGRDILVLNPINGEVLDTIACELHVYALTMNHTHEGSPVLLACVRNMDNNAYELHEIDPVTGGHRFRAVLSPPGSPPCLGLAFVEEWRRDYRLLAALMTEDDGRDFLVGREYETIARWLDVSPDEMVITPGSTRRANLLFDARGLSFGRYDANVILRYNTLQGESTISTTLIVEDPLSTSHVESRPGSYRLHDPVPNPFNTSVVIQFDVPNRSAVQLKLFDLLGREVAQLADATVQPGRHRVTFHAERLASGVYFLRMVVPGQYHAVRKLLMLK
ncbi:S8 family serine peptidase [bacterium]|nr:S8 family serine peptidase [bacterium]